MTSTALPDVARSLVDNFERQVARVPDRVAVGDATRALTYAELDREASRVAGALLAVSPERGETVGLLLGHEAAMLVAILGTLKAGKIYVPLDPALPEERIAHLLGDAQMRAIVTGGRPASRLDSLGPMLPAVVDIDVLPPDAPALAPAAAIPVEALCLLLYTSGSTGEPKGVPHSHRNVVADIRRQTCDLRVGEEDRYGLLFACSSNSSVSSIFGALLNGASVWLFDVWAHGLAGVPRWLDEREITICDFSVGAFRQVAAMLPAGGSLPALRMISLGGEVVTRRDAELCRERLSPDCVLQNAMGSTETRVVAQFFVDRHTALDGPTVPVGYPVDGKTVLILDGDRRPVPVGEVGEIAVQSEYLSPGYWRKPELTESVFLPDPTGGNARIYLTGDLGRQREDGCLIHLGRRDWQVKIRGYRVETAEVETALLALTEVADAFVTAEREAGGEASLVAYVVAAGGPAPTVSGLRAALARTLPVYMRPRAFVILDALPRTRNGKIDQPALPPPPRVRPEIDQPFVAPRSATEAEIARVWEEVLEIEGVGVEDDFVELGGDSLLASRIVSRIAERCRMEPTLAGLFVARTVAELAVEVLQARAAQLDPGALERALADIARAPGSADADPARTTPIRMDR